MRTRIERGKQVWKSWGRRWRRLVRRPVIALAAVVLAVQAMPIAAGAASAPYYPGPDPDWVHRAPDRAGFDPARLDAAIAFAKAHETRYPEDLARVADVRDLELKIRLDFAAEPYNEILGPTKPRGPQTGVVVRGGYIVAEWGEPGRVDMTFSVTKTFLSSVAGLAWDRGLIRNLDDPVKAYVAGPWFESAHNARITWDQMLRQTSEWQGTLWGKPAWADRPGEKPWSELAAPAREPGSRWKYNDVRVNMLALALLQVWRRPLPQVLKEHLMDPIGASATWRWYGYRNSWVVIDGVRMQSVSGGGHWGGGMFIQTYDLARLGLLALRDGRWKKRQILSKDWIRKARTPTPVKPTYGFMNWFLNTKKALLPSAPETSFFFAGAGANIVYVDPEHDLVVVTRWIDRRHLDGFIAAVLAALK